MKTTIHAIYKGRYCFLMIIFLTFHCLVNNALAQSSHTLTGEVRSAADGEPLEGVRVVLGQERMSVYTDTSGLFQIDGIHGQQEIKLSYTGFEPLTFDTESIDLDRDQVFILWADISHVPALRLGDSIPDSLWDLPVQVVNHPLGRNVITLREYTENKLIVLDFWTTYCAPCIRTISNWEETLKEFDEGDIAYFTVYVDFAHRALPFIQDRGWQAPAIVGNNYRVINAHFFDRYQLGGVVFIRDGTFYAAPKDKGYDPAMLTALMNGDEVSIESDHSFLHTGRSNERRVE